MMVEMHRRARWVIPLVLLLFAGCPRPEIAPVPMPEPDITVAQDTTGMFKTISDAVAHARSGQVILVRPGVYREQVRIDKVRGLTLAGTDPATTVVDATGKYSAVELKTGGNRLVGLSLSGADAHGVWVRDSHQYITRCLVSGNGDRGIYISAMYGNASADIDHCTVVDNGVSGIYVARRNDSTRIVDCIVAFNTRGIVADAENPNMTVDRNCLFNTEKDTDRVVPGTGNFIADPDFVDPAQGEYHLSRSSPCLRSGLDRTNRGCF